MASLGVASLRVIANTSAFEQTLRRSIKRIGKTTAALFAGIAAADFFAKATSDAVGLQKQIKEIQTLLDKTNTSPGFDANKAFGAASIRDVSNQIGMSADQVAKSLYLILSSGIPAADAIDTLVAASKGAIAVGADLTNTVDFTTSAVNAYGQRIDKVTGNVYDASRANDILFKALQYGKGSLNDFAKYISTAIPIASQLGVSLEDLAASAAANTLTGQSARKVFTGLKVAMQGLSDTTKGTGKAFLQITGKTFPQFIKEGGKLSEAAKILADNVKGGAGELTNLGGAKEGITALQTLVLQYDKMPGIIKGTNDSIDAASKAADIVNQSISRQVDFLKTRFKNFRGSVGDWLVPIFTRALVALDKFRPKWDAFWSSLSKGIKSGIDTLAPLFTNAFDLIGQAMKSVDWKAVGDLIKTAFQGIALALAPVLISVGVVLTLFGQLMLVLGPIVDLLNNMKPLIFGVAAAFAGYYTALLLINAAQKIWLALSKLSVIWSGLQAAAFVITTAATEGLAAGMVALDIAMDANPIGVVVAVLAALAAAFIYGWKTSETFRDVVTGVWNTILSATQIAVTVFIKLVTAWALAPIYGIDLILKALAHLPKHFGGGAASGAEAAVSALIGQVNSWRDSTISAINDVINAAKLIPAQFNDAAGWNQDAGSITAELAKQGITQASMDALTKPKPAIPVPGGGGGGSFDPSAKNAGASAAKAAASAIKAALKKIPGDLKAINKNISKQTADQIKANFAKLFEDMKAAGKKIPTAWKTSAKTLEKYAKQLGGENGIVAKLNLAKDALKTIKDEAANFGASVLSSFSDLANVTKTGYSSIEGLTFRMQAVLDRTKAFHDTVIALSKTNLDKGILRQIIEAGPDTGMAAASAILAGGQAGINTLNGLQGQIDALGQDTATKTTDVFYKTGIAAAQGIVDGLQASEAKVVAAMEKLAAKVVAAANKVFKIKSPSKAFHEIGAQLPAGMANGIASGIKEVGLTANAMHGAATEGANGIKPTPAMAPSVHVYIGDQELTGMIRVEMNSANRNTKSRASARSRSGVVAGSRGL